MLIRLSAAIALALTIFTSCGMDPDNLYGKRKEFQILDEHGKSTTHAYASKISGTSLKIVGGLGGHHRVVVEDEYKSRWTLMPPKSFHLLFNVFFVYVSSK